ncbi:STAS domain-containing protein [Amycolatopsis vancoresmycina]|uniref:Anti-anti-sigma factor n=1 Tax=Amycolatopsis vancoresmycina DSM 44592 TaxID=1292037 RepID=R1FWL6_9PSEU|nr:STAS domain-containing protein [Amycolatopsis vancoresmycina]EOD63793.1 anti-anti-sigma factor [Amycolatopsis vancoresmycina DSM 44592]
MTDHRTAPRITTTTGTGITTVRCAGELDLGSAARLRDALLEPVRAGARGVVADLTGTTFCDSTVFTVLAEVFRDAAAHDVAFAIAAGETAVARPLQLLGLDRSLPLHSALDAAHAAVAAVRVPARP